MAYDDNGFAVEFDVLKRVLLQIPAIQETWDNKPPAIYTGCSEDGWWMQFPINVHHPLGFDTVQWLAWILNGLCLQEPLPTTFLPSSSCPYLNGPAELTLRWIVDCPVDTMSPSDIAGHLRVNLPRPLHVHSLWKV